MLEGWTHPTLARHGSQWVIWGDLNLSKMKTIHEKDKRIDRSLFFEAQSICQYTSGGDLLNYKSSAKKRVKEFKKATYRTLNPQFIHSDN